MADPSKTAFHEGAPDYEARFTRYMQTIRDVAEALEIPPVDHYRYFDPFYRTEPDKYNIMSATGYM